MSFNSQKISLTDIYEISSGLSKPATFFGTGYPFLSFKDVFNSYFTPDKLSQLVESSEKEQHACSIIRGDIFLTRTSETVNELGMSCVALKDYELATFNGFTKRLRQKKDSTHDVHPEYVGYYLRSQYFRQQMFSLSSMSTRASLNNEMIGRLHLILPLINIQKIIAKILKSLDDKIALNKKINKTLEQMAQALFKSWFVDFEPVKAKIALLEAGGSQQEATLAAMTAISGKDADLLAVFEREQPEKFAELKATAELFPSAMQESELGEIPEGWLHRDIGEYIDNISKTYPLKKVNDVVFLNTGDIKEGQFLHKKKSNVDTLPGQAKKSINKGDILYSEIRPINKRFAYVFFDAEEYVVSTKLMVLRPKLEGISYYIYFMLSRAEAISYLQIMAESRSGTFPQITYDILSKVKIITSYDDDIINSFCSYFLKNMYCHQQSIAMQNETLIHLRDTLLPKLLSGEITLPQAEQALSE